MLYGRGSECSLLDGLLDGARRSRSATLVLRGDPGVGKTALLDHARRQADGIRVVSVSGAESEMPLAFAALHRIVRPLRSCLEGIPPPQADALRGALGERAGAQVDRFLVSLATLSLLAEAAEPCPLLLLVDDAQFLDEASADALAFTARRLAAEGVVMLFAARDGDVRRFEAPDLPELRLDGLDHAAATALLDEHGPSPLSPQLRDRLIDETCGNPLALLELSPLLEETPLTGVDPSVPPIPVGSRIERAYLARVRRLPSPTRSLLLIAAADDTGDVAILLQAAGRLSIRAEALDGAEHAGLLHVTGSRVSFLHPLVRSAVYHAATLAERRAAHGAIAEAIDASSDAGTGAWHRAAAAIAPDPEVVAELDEAAQRARARGDLAAASRALERGASLCAGDEERAARLTAAGEAAWLAGRSDRAQTLLERADRLGPDGTARADIDRSLGLIEMTRGSPARAGPRLLRAARDIAPHDDHRRTLDLLNLASVASVYAGDRETASAIAQVARTLGPPAATLDRMIVELLVGLGCFFEGDLASAVRHLRLALALEQEVDVPLEDQPTALLVAGRAALFLGDDDAVLRSHHRAADRARTNGAVGFLTQLLPRLSGAEMWSGRWGSAAANAQEGLELARELRQTDLVAYSLVLLALLAAHRGQEDECRALAAEGGALASTHRFALVTEFADWALTLLELGRSDHEAAFLRARDVTSSAAVYWSGLDRIEAAVHSGDRATASRWLDDIDAWASATEAPWSRAVVHHGRALVTSDLDEAERSFLAALRAHDEASRPFERARTSLAFGALLRRSRRRVDSREHLRAACDTFDALGARAWAERARRELRASGASARRRGPVATERLTPQELQIARFVARGLSNREVASQLFLSPRTVAFHLRNVFRKLDLTSRTELAHLSPELERSGTPSEADDH